jgi:hypothetical protein
MPPELNDAQRAELFINGHRVGDIVRELRGWRLADKGSVFIAPGEDDFLDVTRLPPTGTVTLRGSTGAPVPLGLYRKRPVTIDWDDSRLRRSIVRSSTGVAVRDRR